MSETDEQAYAVLGEQLMEEILVRAGIQQPRGDPGEQVHITLDFVVSADSEGERLLVRGDRIGKPPLEIGVAISLGGR